jgi:hypothetical protein
MAPLLPRLGNIFCRNEKKIAETPSLVVINWTFQGRNAFIQSSDFTFLGWYDNYIPGWGHIMAT